MNSYGISEIYDVFDNNVYAVRLGSLEAVLDSKSIRLLRVVDCQRVVVANVKDCINVGKRAEKNWAD